MALGNTGISSLMRGATAAREKQLAYNDQAAAYDYNTSAKTEDDYKRYDEYLGKRQTVTSDPSKALTIQTSRNSAYSSFTGKEIQRQTLAVNYGESDNRSKLGAINRLWQQAMASGNENLAQSLESNMASLNMTIQREDEAAANKAAAAGSKAHNMGVTQATNELKVFQAGLDKALRTGTPVINPADGKPLRFKTDKNGQLILDGEGNPQRDDNAQPLRLTDRNYRIMVGNTMQQHASILQNEIDSGNDESGAKQAQLDTLQATPNWEKFAATSINERLQRGEDPYTMKVDELGQISVAPRAVTGQQALLDKNGKPQLDENGKPVVANQYQTGRTINAQGVASDTYDYYRKIGTDVNAPTDDYTQKVLKGNAQDVRVDPITGKPVSTDGQDYVIDPVTGKTMYLHTYVDKNGKSVTQRSLEPLDKQGNVSEAKDFKGGTNAFLKDTGLDRVNPNSLLKAGAAAIPVVGNLLNIANNTRLARKAEAAQQAALVESTRLANERQAAVNYKPVVPSIPVTAAGGRVTNVAGPMKVSPALVKAQNTAGSPSFTQSLAPGVIAGAKTLGLNTSNPVVAPKPAAKPWWKFW